MSVILGIHQRIKEIENHIGVKIESEKKIIHEHFESKYFHDTNDIGLLKLKYPVNFTQNIKPICLPKHGMKLFLKNTYSDSVKKKKKLPHKIKITS